MNTGIDNIPNIILKNIPQRIIFDFCILFNNMLNNSYFPDKWKISKVVLLPKKDKEPNSTKNLRPISLLPNISKIFEVCVNNILCKFCNNNNINSEKQFGFKFKHSTINAIHKITSDINWNWQKKVLYRNMPHRHGKSIR